MPTATSDKLALAYFPNSAELFSTIADKTWAIFLDSAYHGNQRGRYDILACDPLITLQTFADTTQINDRGQLSCSKTDPFVLLKQYLAKFAQIESELPFNGGAIGYFSYDLARRLEKLPNLAIDGEQIADMAIGIYQWAVIVDHHQQQTWLVSHDLDLDKQQALAQQFSQIKTRPSDNKQPFRVLTDPISNLDLNAYGIAFKKIKQYLKEGDCYQVNLTQRFSSRCQGNPWEAYQVLRQLNPAPFSAYLNLPDVQILSSSPERFLQVDDGAVETKPIKGTRPRLADFAQNQAQIDSLQTSTKDRAENLMIVDLLRNDISKNCETGSVKVPNLFAIESYATVHHLVSTIVGKLATQQTAIDLLRSCFPGGSITGAPKIRAMEVIEELEPNRRGIYCGSIGYIGFNGKMDTNIAIRTLIHNQDSIRFWVGGGIVYDSDENAEYQECFDKAAALLKLLAHFKA